MYFFLSIHFLLRQLNYKYYLQSTLANNIEHTFINNTLKEHI
jgi:hypothetical protein